MKLNIDGKEYELNTQRAEELGVLTKVKKHFTVADLKVGDVFHYAPIAGNIYIKQYNNNNEGYAILRGRESITISVYFKGSEEISILNLETGKFEEFAN